MKKSLAITCAALASLIISASAVSAQGILYYNDFANDSGAGLPPENVGWGYIYNNTEGVATAGLLNNTSGNTGFIINQGPGPDGENGFAHLFMQGFKYQTLMYSMDMDVISYTDLTSISFKSGMSNLLASERPFLVLHIDDLWYVSDNRYGSSGSAGSFSWADISVDPFSISWSLLEWDIGNSAIAIGDSAILPETGLLKAVGLWSDKVGENGEHLRFDDFTVSGVGVVVPEPSTYALIGGVMALGVVLLRRRQVS